jgi:parallel beta-helix repeat protein
VVTGNNIVIDCQNHWINRITGPPYPYAGRSGISVSGYPTNVTVRNCNIRTPAGDFGIVYNGVTGGAIINNYISNPYLIGIALYGSNGIRVDSNTVYSYADSIQVRSDSCIIKNNRFYSNTTGYSMTIATASYNTIYNNYFQNGYGSWLSSETNTWNVPLTTGPNIAGGPYIGGNYWGLADGTGFSDTCTDANGDRICDTSMSINSNNTDSFPLAEITVGCGEGIPDFMCFFLDPLFLEVLIAIMLSGYIGYVAKSKWAFAISLSVILLILTLAGDFPLWMLIIFILIVGATVYLIRKEGAEGE